MTTFHYPKGPEQVPDNLTKPNSAYKQRAWLAMMGLAVFLMVYFALACWFVWTAYRLLPGVFLGHFDLWSLLAGGAAAFLAIFMLKALFFVKRGSIGGSQEITREDHPNLISFIYQLADDAGAPRPHKVFLSNTVNACVFYDLSILNLLFPSRKNLEIGLPLVNVLNASEFKAVLAHEFGHFAQQSMAIGSWVYIAQQIAGQVVSRRDVLDKFLKQLSSIDIRISWLGWGLSLIVWSIRSLLDTLFRLVVMTQRALSREMEFQADLVAVSLTGSDALVHALHKLGAADDAWDKTLEFANSRLRSGKAVSDLFTVQERIIIRMREILDDPRYGAVPDCQEDPQSHRVFRDELASPPQMWATHPANVDRENNVKQRYVTAPEDPRSAWAIFDDAAGLRKTSTASLFGDVDAEVEDESDTLAALTAYYSRSDLDRRYRGAFLGRSVVRCASCVDGLFEGRVHPDRVLDELASLYPDSLAFDLQKLRALESDRDQLEAIRDGVLEATGKVIRFRGKAIRKNQLPGVIAEVSSELELAREKIWEHDRRCRSAHMAAAERLGKGWPRYLSGLLSTLHYADHMEANLRDAQGLLHNVVAIVTADRHVSKRELKRLLKVANELYAQIQEVYEQAPFIALDDPLKVAVGIESWGEALGELGLPPATEANINDWMRAIDGWVDAVARPLGSVRMESLEMLLQTESRLSQVLLQGEEIEQAPVPSLLPEQYSTLLPGDERERQKKLGLWDRFQTADGFFPASARLLVAIGIVGAVLGFSGNVGINTITVYNGLATPVSVDVAGEKASVPPFGHVVLSVPVQSEFDVKAWSGDVQIEAFSPVLSAYPDEYVYNIASASPLLEWSAVYGSVQGAPDDFIGAQRWIKTQADVLFDEPPEQIQTKANGGERRVLTGYGEYAPGQIDQLVSGDDELVKVAMAHLRWDSSLSSNFIYWFGAVDRLTGDGVEILQDRLETSPSDVMTHRLLYSSLDEDGKADWCRDMVGRIAQEPENSDLQYLAIRCEEDAQARDSRYLAAAKRWPQNPWMAMSSGYVALGEKDFALAKEQLQQASQQLPSVATYVNVELARLRRLQSGSRDVELVDLLQSAPELAYLNAIESGEDEGSAYGQAMRAQAHGEAADASQLDESDKARLLRLQAASIKASAAQVNASLDLPADRGIDRDTVLLALAIAIKQGRDASVYRDQVTNFFNKRDSIAVLEFIDAVSDGASVEQAEAALKGVDLSVRGLAYAAGQVLLSGASVESWRQAASKLLFVSERPFMG